MSHEDLNAEIDEVRTLKAAYEPALTLTDHLGSKFWADLVSELAKGVGPGPGLGLGLAIAPEPALETGPKIGSVIDLANDLSKDIASRLTLDPRFDLRPQFNQEGSQLALELNPNPDQPLDSPKTSKFGPGDLKSPEPSHQPLAPDDDPSRRFCLRWPLLLARFVSLYSKLYRFKAFGYPQEMDGPAIFICWHSEETTLLPNCGFTRGHIMISRSKDGDILASVVKKWGYLVSRGSSSKGAVAALRSMKKAIDAGDNLILAVDGPRGPRRVAKPGAFYLAAKTGRPIYPVGAAVSLAHVFKKSWSHSRLPWPGARVAAVFGPPLRPTLEDLDKPVSEWVKALADGLALATNQAEDYLKNWP